MNLLRYATALLLALPLIALSGCGKKEEEVTKEDIKSMVQEEAAKSKAESDNKLAEGLAKAKADAEKAAEAAATKAKQEAEAAAKAEMEAQLAAQKAELTKQFEASNKALRDQVAALTKKFEANKEKLPEPVVSAMTEKLPELDLSVDNLESLVSQFSPGSLDQLNDFKKKYEKEIAIAKDLSSELLKLLENTQVGDALKSIPGL